MKPQLIRSLYRSGTIPPVALSSEDIRKLHDLLEKKVNEAREIQIGGLQRSEQMDDGQFEGLKKNVRDQFYLTVMVQGTHGEQLIDTTGSPLAAENLPDEITTINFECSYLFRLFFNFDPRNRTELNLNFQRQRLLDFSNPSGKPTTPVSYYNVTGDNETWVNGVYESLKSFFHSKELNWNFIHGNYFYDLLLWVIILPAAFWTLYRFSIFLDFHHVMIPSPLSVGLYFYFAIFLLLVFRVLFNYLRWLYPRVEHTDSRIKPTLFHRLVLFTIVTGILTTFITDLIRTIF